MLGAIIGDLAGSRFEWKNYRAKDFELLSKKCFFTDDTVMTLAICQALLACREAEDRLGEEAVRAMQTMGRRYAGCGYGGRFRHWLFEEDPRPYHSYGNGAAMRVSGCGFAASTMEQALSYARRVTEVTHDHPEGIRGAEATAAAIYLARTGSTKEEIRAHIREKYYALDFTLDEIRPSYTFDVSCQGSVPQALTAFLESESFEDTIRGAVSLGGDSDTIAAIAGGVAEAYYGIPENLRQQAMTFLDENLRAVVREFEAAFPLPR